MYIHKCTNKKTLEGGAHMEVTEVRIKKVNSGNKMKAVAQVTFDQEFVVHDIKVIEGRNGLFIAMPRKEKNGTFKIANAILKAYDEAEDPEPVSETPAE